MKITDSKYIGIISEGAPILKKVTKNEARKQEQCSEKHYQYDESYSGNQFSGLNKNFSTKRSRLNAYRRPFSKSSRKSNKNIKIQELPRITEVSEVNSSV